MDKDEATRRQERDAEAAAKRQQNLLPAWHLKSTITGDLTALGIQENARTMAVQPAFPSGDESLKGLGTIGPPRLPQVPQPSEDIKPEINTEADCKLNRFNFSSLLNFWDRLRTVLCFTGGFQHSFYSSDAVGTGKRRPGRGRRADPTLGNTQWISKKITLSGR